MKISLYQKLHKFIQLPTTDKALLLQAIWGLMKNGFILFIIPRKQLAPALLYQHKQNHKISHTNVTANQVFRAVKRASRLAPVLNTCLLRSLTAAQLLHRHQLPCKVIFGLAKNEQQKLMAHAWLEVDQQQTFGYQKNSAFHPLWELNY
ncbi:MAG: lasso peptide biosynthesis B2 protein [Bacteroidetes bacterium]|jgi:hypothetical protein|nr:lasso peptide biosynthesis B2 protein [Bacteroidota bacterium]